MFIMQPFGISDLDKQQSAIVEDIKKLRAQGGPPHKFTILRKIVKTRQYTYTVYPPGWRWQ